MTEGDGGRVSARLGLATMAAGPGPSHRGADLLATGVVLPLAALAW